MEIYVVLKAYRQVEGEYHAHEVEAAFAKKEDAEAFLKDKPGRWNENKVVPLDNGQSMTVEFVGVRGVQPTILQGA